MRLSHLDILGKDGSDDSSGKAQQHQHQHQQQQRPRKRANAPGATNAAAGSKGSADGGARTTGGGGGGGGKYVYKPSHHDRDVGRPSAILGMLSGTATASCVLPSFRHLITSPQCVTSPPDRWDAVPADGTPV
jgi:hypothetical protein